jgi:hypothetical protein
MVPIDPPPPVKFEEFDGMNRIIFSRPNKTVRGNFQAKGVMKMLEQNRRTWIAIQKTVRLLLPPRFFRSASSSVGAMPITLNQNIWGECVPTDVINDSLTDICIFADIICISLSMIIPQPRNLWIGC